MKYGTSLRIISYCTINIAFIYSIYAIMQPRMVSYIIDAYAAPHVVQACKELCTPAFLQKRTARTILKEMQNKIISLEHCSISYGRMQEACVRLSCAQPYATINENLVLTKAGTIVPATEYQEGILERVLHLQTDDPTLHDAQTVSELFAFVNALPAEITENYSIAWLDKTKISLKPADTKSYELYALYTTRFTPELLQAITTVEHALTQKLPGAHKGQLAQHKGKKRVGEKIIDVRVKGQIIVKHTQEGV